MSWTWNVILSFGDEEYWTDDAEGAVEVPPPLIKINKWLEANEKRGYGPLKDLSLCSGGVGITANVYGAGFKHFDIFVFCELIEKQDWQGRSNVQLFVKGEGESRFTLIKFDGEHPKGEIVSR